MSLELVNTLATFGTFLVIAATAIAALVQLRHSRSSNQIVVLNEIRETMESPEFQAARHFAETELPVKIQDPEFRIQFAERLKRTHEMQPLFEKINAIGNFWENVGVFVKAGLLDRDLALDLWSGVALVTWERFAPLTAVARRSNGALWENFEYLAMLSEDFQAAHANGTYPVGARRLVLKDEWLEADKQYAASLAPA
ncbi:MAG: hypothetical protein JO302_01460 [Candidatus Eremiobacteraeota bacterium]|nr:hypothetical protein [Candidatus Eremiobacteraeota bacterium]